MNTESLFLFLILLLGLVLCSFLGGNCNKEGFHSNNSSSQNAPNYNNIGPNNNVNGPNTNVSNRGPNNNNSFSSTQNYDNYNHFNGSSSQLSSGTTFYGPNGGNIQVSSDSNGNQSLHVRLSSAEAPIILTPSQSNKPLEGYTNYSGQSGSATTFYGPNGVSATVATINGQEAIKVTTNQGSATFTQQGPSNNSNVTPINSSQYYGSTGTPILPSTQYNGPHGGSAGSVTGPAGNTAYYAQGPAGNTVAGVNNNPYNNHPYNNITSTHYNGPYGGSAGSVTGPAGNTAYYAQGPAGNAVVGTNTNMPFDPYNNVLPRGIPAHQISPGSEDLYILKSEVIPPVCPACPMSSACPREEPCPACPPCGRCPEPAFDCKKVPNYNAIDNSYLPAPVLNDFSSFGM
jgi:hypothetical protein